MFLQEGTVGRSITSFGARRFAELCVTASDLYG